MGADLKPPTIHLSAFLRFARQNFFQGRHIELVLFAPRALLEENQIAVEGHRDSADNGKINSAVNEGDQQPFELEKVLGRGKAFFACLRMKALRFSSRRNEESPYRRRPTILRTGDATIEPSSVMSPSQACTRWRSTRVCRMLLFPCLVVARG